MNETNNHTTPNLCAFVGVDETVCTKQAEKGQEYCEEHSKALLDEAAKKKPASEGHNSAQPPVEMTAAQPPAVSSKSLAISEAQAEQMRAVINVGTAQVHGDEELIEDYLEAWFKARVHKKLPEGGILHVYAGTNESLVITDLKTGKMVKAGSTARKSKEIVSVPIGLGDDEPRMIKVRMLEEGKRDELTGEMVGGESYDVKIIEAQCPMCAAEGKGCNLDGRNRRGNMIRHCRPFDQLAIEKNRKIESENRGLPKEKQKPLIKDWEVTEEDLLANGVCGHHAFVLNEEFTRRAIEADSNWPKGRILWMYVPYYDLEEFVTEEERAKREAAGTPIKVLKKGQLTKLKELRERCGVAEQARETALAFIEKGGLTYTMDEMVKDAMAAEGNFQQRRQAYREKHSKGRDNRRGRGNGDRKRS